MKQFLYMLGIAALLAGIYTSCKSSSLDTMHADEVVARDKYVKDNNLTANKDVSGIYFKTLLPSTDTTWIRSGFKVMCYFKITLIDGTVVFTTEDSAGRNYEEFAFYVDISNTVVNAQYVQQISGLHKGLKKMHVGETAFMVIPSELAFKAVDNSGFGVPRFSTLLVTIFAKRAYSPTQQQ